MNKLKKDLLLGHRYQLIELLGKGGMSSVWLALDTKLNTRVALKFLSDELSAHFQQTSSLHFIKLSDHSKESSKLAQSKVAWFKPMEVSPPFAVLRDWFDCINTMMSILL